MFIWTICGSLRLSQILSTIKNFHDRGPERNFRFWLLFEYCHFWLVSELQVSKLYSKVFFSWFEGFVEVWGWVKILSKIETFHDRGPWRNFRFWPLFEHCHFGLVSYLQVWILYSKVFLVDLKDLWKFEDESKFCQNLKILMTAVLSEISDFDHFLNNVISDLSVNCKYQNDILKYLFVLLNHLLKFEVESKFCQKLKILMTAVLSEISDFDHFLNIAISDVWVNCKCQNNIVKFFFVDFNYFWNFEVKSKFCQKLKIFMTAVLSEISDFDRFLNIVISDLWVNCKYQNHILKCFFVVFNHFWKFEVESKILSKIENFDDRGP